ncbi:MAG: ectoine/hydroxyectoine ABC transporter substrate-binding protein EhuB [Humidesulfovibrio sp.]|nr:ectoine/hydroxyectoine ABC transporter substrate-binding protein EhuB [Humidesulfovibrio sp.]
MSRRTLAAIAAIAVAALLAAAFGLHGILTRDRSLSNILGSGTIRIGYAVEAPYAFLLPGGQVTGQSPELAKRIAAKLGIGRIEWRVADFGALITELEEGRIDVIAAGMFITPGRAKRINFSEPIFHVAQGLLVTKGNPHKLTAYTDALADSGVRMAALTGSVEADILRRIGLPESQMILVPDALTGRVAVESGVADALALSSPTIAWMGEHEQLGKTEKAQPFKQPEEAHTGSAGYGAFAFRKGDKKLLQAWNTALKDTMAGTEYQDIMHRFGFARGEYPGTKSTGEILAQ